MTNPFNIIVLVLLLVIVWGVLFVEHTTGKREQALQERCEELEHANRTLANLYVQCQSELERKGPASFRQVGR